MKQEPAAGQKLLKWVGDTLEVNVFCAAKELGRGTMVFRTNIGAAAIHQAEVLAHVDENRLISGDDWHDVPMTACGKGKWTVRIPLLILQIARLQVPELRCMFIQTVRQMKKALAL